MVAAATPPTVAEFARCKGCQSSVRHPVGDTGGEQGERRIAQGLQRCFLFRPVVVEPNTAADAESMLVSRTPRKSLNEALSFYKEPIPRRTVDSLIAGEDNAYRRCREDRGLLPRPECRHYFAVSVLVLIGSVSTYPKARPKVKVRVRSDLPLVLAVRVILPRLARMMEAAALGVEYLGNPAESQPQGSPVENVPFAPKA